MLKLYTYRIPFKQPFITGAGTFNFREGLLVRYYDQTIDVISEVAPLPGFSDETLDKASTDLRSSTFKADQFFSKPFLADHLNRWIHQNTATPSAAFGLSSLGLFILSARKQAPVHKILKMNSPDVLQVNAVIGSTSETDFLKKADAFISNGFSVLKCKVTSVVGHLPGSMKKIIEKYPGVTFRLDANRSWPRKKLPELSSKFDHLPIEYIEEPCPVKSIDDLKTVIAQCTIPVAADESLTEFGLINVIEKLNTMPFLIIKPMLHGNLMELFATISRRFHLENRVIITTALESAVGTRAIASIASMIGSRSTAHGLNTGTLFQTNLFDENIGTDGTFHLNQNSKRWLSFQDINQTLITPLL